MHAAFVELLECRSFLQHSYAFAFFRYPTMYYIRRNRIYKLRERERATFEQFQSELEMMTEQLSDIVARMHLRATQTQIMFLTKESAGKRQDFSSCMISLLNDERKEKMKKENKAGGEELSYRTDPQPLDLGGLLEQLEARPTLGLVPDETDSDDDVPENQVPARRSPERDDEDDAAMQEALRASLQAFAVESHIDDDGNGGNGNNDEDSCTESPFAEFCCSACTYVNSRGRRCQMCGTPRN